MSSISGHPTERVRITVHITPNAPRNMIAGRMPDGTWRVKVQSPPVEGAANRCLVKYLAEIAGVPKSRVKIVSGETSRHKIVDIEGDEESIRNRLEGPA